MARDIDDYFKRRLLEEERLASLVGDPAAGAAHKQFVAVYRAYLEGKSPATGDGSERLAAS